jgi:hypothetical protein
VGNSSLAVAHPLHEGHDLMMDIEGLLNAIVNWGQAQGTVRAIALVGSYARQTARPDSDVDVVILTTNPVDFHAVEWVYEINWDAAGQRVQSWEDKHYGVLWSRHIRLESNLEVELGFAPLSWANTQPIDRGTHKVMSDGHRILWDPDKRLSQLADSL